MNKKTLIFAFSILLIITFVWGLIGSSQSAEIGTTCDFGVDEDGSVFCWKWHKNIIGELGDTIDDIFEK